MRNPIGKMPRLGEVQRGLQRLRQEQNVDRVDFTRRLFTDTRLAIIWLPVRLWLAAIWLQFAFIKLTDPEWMGSGETLRLFLVNAQGQAGEAWYRAFLGFLIDSGLYVHMAKVVAFGELAVGLGILVGGLTGLAAFFGATMNFNYLLAASTGPDPIMLVAGVALMIAWKVSGHIGADYVLLPALAWAWDRRPGWLARATAQPVLGHPKLATRAATAFSVSAISIFAFASLGLFSGGSAHGPVLEGQVTVPMTASAFEPKAITVRAGTVVTWTNPSRLPHTVTSGSQPKADGRFDSGLIKAGAEYTYTFHTPGTYSYYCVYHPGMTGTVTVVGTAN